MQIQAKLITDAVEYVNQNAYDTLNIRAAYSGRAMYGDECFGIVGTDQYLNEFEATLAVLVTGKGSLWSQMEGYDVLDALTDLRDTRREDSMGLSRIFYYPSLSVEGELKDTDYEY